MRYFASGVDRTLFQWSFALVKSVVGVEAGPSYAILYPPTVMRTLFLSLIWVLMLHTMWQLANFLS